MTQQSAKQFIEKWQQEPMFQKRVSTAKDQTQVMQLLKENGFSFTKSEYKAAAKEMLGKQVSDTDLEKIVGGLRLAYLQE